MNLDYPIPINTTQPPLRPVGHRIIDMRCRPAYLHDFFGATSGSPGEATARWLNRRVGTRGEAGLSRAVVVGRHTPSQHLPNDLIHSITHGQPELIGIGSVDPALLGEAAALAEVERAIQQLGLAGIDLEPGFGAPPRHPDDPIYFPIYELCAQLNVPVFLMSGPTTPDLRYNDPAPVAKVAQAFPQLPIVCYHGYYPNVQQIIGVAFRYENVRLVPDMYLFLPGSSTFVEAANGFMADQLLFGSSYPFRPIGQTIDDFLALGFKEGILDKLLYRNAADLLGLD